MSFRCECGYDISNGNWKFCKKCGTTTGRLAALPNEHSVELAIGSRNDNRTMKFPVMNEGLQPVEVEVELLPMLNWVQLASPVKFRIGRDSQFDVQLSVDPPEGISEGEHEIVLRFTTPDKRRTHDNDPIETRWKLYRERHQDVRFLLNIKSRPGLSVIEQFLIFTRKRPSDVTRQITLTNTGPEPIALRSVTAPPGFDVFAEDQGQLTRLRQRTEPFQVPAQSNRPPGQGTLIVRLEDIAKVREQLARSVPLVLKIVDELDRESHVRLHVVDLPGAIVRAPYIVSIDFGTENTSAYGRKPQRSGSKVEPVPLFPTDLASSDGDKYVALGHRVPSYIAYDKRNRSALPIVGKPAKEFLGAAGSNREYTVERDVKLWIRSEDAETRLYYEKVLVDYLSAVRIEINRWLHVKFQEAIPDHIKYVITLPVLDNGTKYQAQRWRMETALLRVYAIELQNGLLSSEDFVFVQEPQAAAACFLLNPIPGQAQRSYRVGDLIAVIDSGAGTTDLALVQITDPGDVTKFDVLATQGTSLDPNNIAPLELAPFGGRWVDDAVWELMCRRAAASTLKKSITQVSATEIRGAEQDVLVKVEALLSKAGLMGWVENGKIKLNTEPEANLRDEDPGYNLQEVGERGYIATQDELRTKLSARMDEIVSAISNMQSQPNVLARLNALPPEQRSLRYVIAVGGNSSHPVIEEYLRNHFGRDRVVGLTGYTPQDQAALHELRMTAVVQGGAWSYDAPIGNLCPFTLAYELVGMPGKKMTLLHENQAIIGEWQRHSEIYEINEPTTVQIIAELGALPFRLCRIDLSEPGEYRLKFTLTSDWAFKVARQKDDAPFEDVWLCHLK